nr:MAG TPA: DASH complex subunit Dad1 [Caudoviricetes sp.]
MTEQERIKLISEIATTIAEINNKKEENKA